MADRSDLTGLGLAAVERAAQPPGRRTAHGFHRIPEIGGGGLIRDIAQLTIQGAVADANAYLAGKVKTRARFDRVADLVEGFETPFGLELLSTVHWVAKQERAMTADAVIARTYAWNERKRQFTPGQIKLALQVLAVKDWISDDMRRHATTE